MERFHPAHGMGFGQPGTGVSRKIGHAVDLFQPLGIEPLGHLPCGIRLEANRGRNLGEPAQRFSKQRCVFDVHPLSVRIHGVRVKGF